MLDNSSHRAFRVTLTSPSWATTPTRRRQDLRLALSTAAAATIVAGGGGQRRHRATGITAASSSSPPPFLPSLLPTTANLEVASASAKVAGSRAPRGAASASTFAGAPSSVP
jgi:hypothetical protein